MRIALRFVIPLFLVIGTIAWMMSPLVGKLMQQWFMRDVEMRSQLVFSSIQNTVIELLEAKADSKINALFKNIAQDERMIAIGFCMEGKKPTHQSGDWPKNLKCPVPPLEQGAFTIEHTAGGPMLVSAFNLYSEEKQGHIVILHNLGFIELRNDRAGLYLAGFLTLLGIGAAGVTVIVARLTLRDLVRAIRRGLSPSQNNREQDKGIEPEIEPLIKEMRKMLREFDSPHILTNAIRIDWNAESLRNLLRKELPDTEVIVVSNREPYIHNQEEDKVILQRPASGLVTAMEPIMRACGGTWIAHGSGSADHLTVDSQSRIGVPPDAPSYTLKRVWLSDEEQDGYYYGLANEGLWPLCHITFVRPIFRDSDWQQYVKVNRKFADAVISEAKTENPIILIQDYHFALLPKMIREKLPGAIIITFWHIPWPNPEVFSICPWKEELLSGMLGSSILGFHTQFHCLNFLDSVDRFLECHIDREHSTIRAGRITTSVKPYPISIEWPPSGLVNQPNIEECRKLVRENYNLAPDIVLGIGVERFDYTKGISDRFRAVERMLENHPQWIGKFTLLQIAAPTRSRLSIYQETQEEAEKTAAEINRKFAKDGWVPLILVSKHHEPDQVFTLFRAADLCMVSSLHDGMNLVAKEFVAARDDEDGVLILSTFAGASRELLEALIVNPYDVNAMGEAIHKGLSMPKEKRKERMRLMREMVGEFNIYFWAGRMLMDAAKIKKRQKIEQQVQVTTMVS